MTSRGKTLKLTAVSTLVVLALTGFSTGRGHGGSSARPAAEDQQVGQRVAAQPVGTVHAARDLTGR
ncbi:hypothetical protein ABZ476_19730, partial [Streptomyces albogriseolus]